MKAIQCIGNTGLGLLQYLEPSISVHSQPSISVHSQGYVHEFQAVFGLTNLYVP